MSADTLEGRLARWVESGIITVDQAEAIRVQESSGRTEAEAQASPDVALGTGTRVPVMAEVLGYVGGALAIAALIAIIGEYWNDLGEVGQLGLAGLVAVVCLAGGGALARLKAPQAKRLGYFLLFLGVAATGALAGLAANMLTVDPELPFVVASACALGVAAVVWWFHKTALQLVAVTGSVAVLVTSSAVLWGGNDTGQIVAYSFMLLGALWCAAGQLGLLRPRTTAWVLGSAGVLVGPQLLIAESYDTSGEYLVMGLLVSLALIGAALWVGRTAPLGFGAAGIVIYVPQLLFEFFEDTIGAPIGLLAAGVLLVAMSALVIVARPRLKTRRATSDA